MLTGRTDRAPVALLAGFVLLVLIVAGALWLVVRQDRAAALVLHTLEVEGRLTDVLSRLQDAETGERGYLLTRQKPFLDPYREATANLDGDLAALEAAVGDNVSQLARARELTRLATDRNAHLGAVIATFDRSGIVPVGQLEYGKRLMDRIRVVVATMKSEEERLLPDRRARAQWRLFVAIGALILAAIGTCLLGLYAFSRMRGQLMQVQSAHDALEQANARLIEEAQSRERVEAQARQMQKMEAVGQLTGGIAHDFNNMLAIVVGSLDMAKIRASAGDHGKAAACVDNAMEGAQRAAQLTSRLLAFSRQQPLAPAPVDANKMVGGMSEMLRRTIGEHLRVETVLAGGLWPTFADANQLDNALLNLCVNARDAMPDGGRLTIETANAHLDDAYAAQHPDVKAGQYVLVSVSDTGTGMPPEVIERAFDPFYTTKGVGKGTGLGLSQVFGFVKQSNGHVKIYSEPGQGTTVKIYLPRALQDAVHPTGTLSGNAARLDDIPRARGEEFVLVVEDDEGVRHTSVETLRELGYTVVQASDAQQALALLELQPRIDLMFTDVVMPDMNGRLLAERVAKGWPDVRVLYTTGYTRNAIVHNGMLDPGVDLLSKPFTLEQLAMKVRQVLDR